MTAIQKPKGLVILAWLCIVFGGLSLAFVFDSYLYPWERLYYSTGLLNIVFGLGALKLKPWAWTYGIVTQVIEIFAGFLYIFNFEVHTGYISIIFGGLILYYLCTAKVKRVFGRA